MSNVYKTTYISIEMFIHLVCIPCAVCIWNIKPNNKTYKLNGYRYNSYHFLNKKNFFESVFSLNKCIIIHTPKWKSFSENIFWCITSGKCKTFSAYIGCTIMLLWFCKFNIFEEFFYLVYSKLLLSVSTRKSPSKQLNIFSISMLITLKSLILEIWFHFIDNEMNKFNGKSNTIEHKINELWKINCICRNI